MIDSSLAASLATALNNGTQVGVITNSSQGGNGNIIIASDIIKNVYSEGAALFFKACNNITLGEGVTIGSEAGKMDIYFNADSDGNNSGAILLENNSKILSQGGKIDLGGGLNNSNPFKPGNSFAVGSDTANYKYGICLDGAILDSAGGDINLRGSGYNSSSYGIYLTGGSSINSRSLGWSSLLSTGAKGIYLDGEIHIDNGGLKLISNGDVRQTSAGTIQAHTLNLSNSGTFTLDSANNEIDILAADVGSFLKFKDNTGFQIGWGDGIGGLQSNKITLSSAGNVTQAQSCPITAVNLELVGSGDFTLDNANNAITTLAGSVGSLRLKDNNGFTIGTVNSSNGLLAMDNIIFTSLGNINQSQAIQATGLGLLGGGNFALGNINNSITTLAGQVDSIKFRDDTGFTIGTVDSVSGFKATNNIRFDSQSNVTQEQAIEGLGLELVGIGGRYILNNQRNNVSSIAGNTGSIEFTSSNSFAIGSVNSSIGLTTSHNQALVAGNGDITIKPGTTLTAGVGEDIILAASKGNFINCAGGSALSTSGGGRWLIYSSSPTTIIKGGLGASKSYNHSFVDNPPDSIDRSKGNLFLYSIQPKIIVIAEDQIKTYGNDNPPLSYVMDNAGLIDGDLSVAAYRGLPFVYTMAKRNSAVGDYPITVSQGNLISDLGYLFEYRSGRMTIEPVAQITPVLLERGINKYETLLEHNWIFHSGLSSGEEEERVLELTTMEPLINICNEGISLPENL